MKKLLFAIGILLLTFPVLNAGQNIDSTLRIIGFNIYHANSVSGYGQSIDLNLSIERERRHLEAGVIMQLESARISGGEILYRHYLSPFNQRENTLNDRFGNLRFYFQYNFIFRKHILPDNSIVIPSTFQEAIVPGGRIATFEHYIGAGGQLELFDNLFLNASIGYGIILGSIDNEFQNELHHTMGGRKNDYGMSTRFGFSYYIFKSTH